MGNGNDMMEGSVWGHLPLLLRASSKESVEYILEALWRTRRTGLDAADRKIFRDILQLPPDDSDLDSLLVCLRVLIRRCVYDNIGRDEIQKLFPAQVLPELQRLLTLLLQKFQKEWREDISKDQATLPRPKSMTSNIMNVKQTEPAAIINFKLNGDAQTNSDERDVKFGFGKDTMEMLLKSMYCVRNELSEQGEAPNTQAVSRRDVRKNKFVDFVGEYHLDLIVSYGAVPVIVPRVAGVHTLLDNFGPIHGVLLCEGEDIDPSLYPAGESGLSPDELNEICRLHASDTAFDHEKDAIELALAKLCLERNIPYLGICRGSQVLNVACGGTLYQDIDKELSLGLPKEQRVAHIDYENYDGHRHPARVVVGTPLQRWFKASLGEGLEIWVNSYHHQGVMRLAHRFVPMAFAPDGLVEGFYDPDVYCPEEGKFIMGLQFHPERMRRLDSDEFDYPGCPFAYQEFVKAAIAYQKKLNSLTSLPKHIELDGEMEKKRKIIVKSFSLARNIYEGGRRSCSSEESGLEAGAEFLELSTALSQQQETRLKQMGATVRKSTCYLEKLKQNEGREKLARSVMGKMSVERLSNLLSFYHMMGQICTEVLDRKLHDVALNDLTY